MVWRRSLAVGGLISRIALGARRAAIASAGARRNPPGRPRSRVSCPIPAGARSPEAPRGPSSRSAERLHPLPAGSSGGALPRLSAVAKDVVAEFASKGLTEEGLSIALIEIGGVGGRPGPSGVTSLTIRRRSSRSFFLAYYEAQKESGEVEGHAGARARRQGHDHRVLQRRDRVRRGHDHGHDLGAGDLGRRLGEVEGASATR